MSTSINKTTLAQDIGAYLHHQLRGWRGLIALAVVLAVPAVWFGWPWLVAAGLAPLILTVAPCAIMCGLGLCMNRMGRTSNFASGASNSAARSTLQGEDAVPTEPLLGSCCAEGHSLADAKGAATTEGANLPTKTQEIVR